MKQRNNPIVYFFLLIITTSFLPLINGYGISSLKQNFNINPEDISIDYNFDKIDDRILPELKLFGSKSIDVIVKFDRRINSFDRIRLANIGATSLSSSWNLERCIKITINSRLLKVITNFPGVEFISKAEKRAIMVAIEGNNFEDLNRLKNYPQTEIYWNVGCALVPFYSGIENDLNLLGSFSYIQDITDSYLETTIIPIDNNDLTISTVKNAETINATSLWDLGYNGSGVKIGNIDTGINSAHLDFAGRIMAAQSFILTNYGYEYNDTTTSDPNGHGSHTTGIMAGNGTGNIAYKGIAPESEIYFAKIGNPATLYSVVVALDWLVTQGVETINFSYGGSDSTGLDIAETAMRNVVRNNGILLSLSAGNDGDDGFYTVGTPGTTDDVITVGNVNDWNNPPLIVSSSARGPTADDHMKPDLMAPGYGIYSCGPTGTVSYVVKSGTSMAAPQVTGSIALLIQACKNNGIDYNPGLLKGALMKTATLKTPISSYNLLVQGRGIVNVGAAWNLIVNSAKEDLMPIIGACNPVQQPLHYWSTLLQGQVSEQYLTCVSPFKSDLSIEVSGDISSFITIDPIPEEYTSIVKIKYSIPINATIGSYSGQINFKYKTNTLDSISLILSVAESNGHR
ncbi:MAG: S8 family serine peptidase, partial [Candidatus Thorarchaeota archaeon]